MNTDIRRRIAPAGRDGKEGYTLIELLVVLAIVALLLSLAVPRYFQNIEMARETILAENLVRVRETIDRFHGDTGRYPDSLEELVERHYLRSLPVDPMTESQTNWIIIAPEQGVDGQVGDIRSSASGNTRSGLPFSAL